MRKLTEEAGNSYSGFYELIHEGKVDPLDILHEIDGEYNILIKSQNELEEKLDFIKRQRAMCVSNFYYVNRASGSAFETNFISEDGKNVILIQILSSDPIKIDYNKKPLINFEL